MKQSEHGVGQDTVGQGETSPLMIRKAGEGRISTQAPETVSQGDGALASPVVWFQSAWVPALTNA